MQTATETRDSEKTRQELRRLFDAAAARSLSAVDQPEAEPEMSRFLHAVTAHPEQREFSAQLFTESLVPRRAPWEFVQFCMHALRWPEIRNFIRAKRAEDVEARGARSSTVWDSLLEAFEDHWEWAEHYEEFRRNAPGTL
jgi:hypothetical protein